MNHRYSKVVRPGAVLLRMVTAVAILVSQFSALPGVYAQEAAEQAANSVFLPFAANNDTQTATEQQATTEQETVAEQTTPTEIDPAAVIGQGFTVTPADLAFILKQIKIAEYHVANTNSSTGPCGALLGNGPDQIASPLLSFGLRTVDGTCNNLVPGQETFGAVDKAFPRLTTPIFKPAENVPPGLPPVFGSGPTSYAQTTGNVFDTHPRTVSNLIVDQTSTNPAAVAAAGFPVRSQGAEGVVPCTIDPSLADPNGTPDGCVPSFQTLSIENVTTDVGLSPPFNDLFTIFGQFFDHGLDKITNGGNGTVFVPLKADDPLVAGPDHIFGNSDDLPPNLRFMVMSRGTIIPGADGFRNAPNTNTPFVDQSQTYTSHSSHQVFTREYINNSAGRPVATGKFLSSPDGGLPTWAQVKAQAATLLGLQLVDANVGNIPMIAADPYGKFIPGPLRGLPQYVTATGLVEGNTAAPVLVPANAIFINTAFLNDIAHSAAPTADGPDSNNTAGGSLDTPVPAGTYDNELLDLHAICGDGRCNENIALVAIHQVFHNEHDRLVNYIKNVLTTDTSGVTTLADWQLALGANGWNGERLFQAARFITEMQYQHLVFEEFARKVQPGIDPFQLFAFNQTNIDPAITAEFAHAVYRFGHSMLNDMILRVNANGSRNDISLFDAFLNPAAYHNGGPAGTLSSADAAGAIFMGLSDQAGQEIDEFVIETLRNKLLGLPLDLAALNLARGRSEGIPSLNNARRQIYATTQDVQLTPYTDWVDFGQALKHPESLVNFVAAYGKHPNITGLDPDGAGPILTGSLAARRTAADQIVNGTMLPGPDGILGPNPATALDDIPAVAAGPGPDNDFGVNCDTANPAPACADNTPAVPAQPGPDGILGPDPSTALDDVPPPADSADFMFSTGVWANVGNTSITGVDDIDLWIGGLAERTNVFGGLLGSTFNYVFEKQLTDLQNGDRFYYLARTLGMNLLNQLEGNSFGEIVIRNTNASALKSDSFATSDCKFYLGNLTWPAVSGSFITGAGSVNDDPASECNENRLLLRMPDGTIRYRATNSVDPAGINGQSVYSGTPGIVVDRMYGGNDSDTFWGGQGNDIIEGGDGGDVALGGEGNDIINDLNGDDVHKGGPGNDAINGGPGLDILMGGDGNDLMDGGANSNESFGGEGNDFFVAGNGSDGVFGGGGDDWAEGGDQLDLLIGDNSTFFFTDHNLPGHDVLIGQGGDDDYDAEGGDDIMLADGGLEKNAGAAGYDWAVSFGFNQPYNADLALPIVENPTVGEVLDRSNEVEGLSGWNLDDTLRGDNIVPADRGAVGGFIGCDALDAAGVARIANLDTLVPAALRTIPAATLAANSATNFCLLTGLVWGDGNIILGGGGSDTIEGRGANDIIDGDRYISVRLSIRTNPNNPASEIGSTHSLSALPATGTYGSGTAGMTLRQAIFAGLVDPGNIVIVRELLNAGPGASVDTAVYAGNIAEYTITQNPNGSVTVAHIASTLPISDGIDTLYNIESLQFADTVVGSTVPTPAPAVSLNPTSLTFANQIANTASAALPVVLSNIGNASLSITNIAISGDFAQANNCPLTLAAGASCTINVLFTPTAAGTRTGTLTITDNAAGSPHTVALSGTGLAPLAPVANLNLTSLTFASQTVNVTSTGQQVVLTNSGNAALTISSIVGSAEFAQTNNCPASLGVGASCTINVTFTPAAPGARTGTLTITSSAAGSPHTVALSGTGVAGTPVVSLSPTSLTFANQTVNTTSAAQVVTLSNTGTAALTIASIAASGDFAQTHNCPISPATLATGASCTINVTFTPTASGVRTGGLTITDNAGGSPRTVALGGTGQLAPVPVVSLNPTSLTFASQTLNTTSAAQVVTLSNTGTAALTISSITISPEFAQTHNCPISPATLAAGASCTINVTFTPTATGARPGTLSITDNAGGSPRSLALSGTGVAAAAPAVTLSPTSLTFASQGVNTTSAAQNVTLSNVGTAVLNITSIVASGDFARTTTCGATLAAGATCTISVTFTPTAAGARAGAITITDNAGGSPRTIALNGTGGTVTTTTTTFAPVADTYVRLDSATTIFGTAGTIQSVDGGSARQAFIRFTVTGLPVGATISSATIRLFPTNGSTSGGIFNLITNNTWSEATTNWNNRPTIDGTTVATLGNTPANTAVNVTLPAGTITGNGTYNFAIRHPTGNTDTLAYASRQNGTVANRPQLIIVSTTGGGGPVAPAVTLSPTSLTFASQTPNTTSAAQQVTLSNSGTAALSINSIVASAEFAQTNNCPASLAAGASCTINVTFTPAATGARTGTLTITDNAAGSPHTVALSGTGGTAPSVSLTPATLTFAIRTVNTTSPAQNVTLTNNGTAVLDITSIVASGDFARTTTCGATLAAGASCTISVTFTPTATGTRTGAITITDNAVGSPHTVALSGTGTAAGGTTSTFQAVDDTFVEQADPTDTGNGTRTNLRVVGAANDVRQSFIRFTVSGLPAGATVSNARLRLVVINDSTSGGIINRITNNTWTEATTWNTRPAIDGTVVATLGAVVNGVVEVTLPAGTITGNGTYNFAITHPAGNTNTLDYASSESTTLTDRPQLLVTIN